MDPRADDTVKIERQAPPPAAKTTRPGPKRDKDGVPFVRLTRTVQSGIGIGIGILIVQVVAVLLFLLLAGTFVRSAIDGGLGGVSNTVNLEEVDDSGVGSGLNAEACALVMNEGFNSNTTVEAWAMAQPGTDVEQTLGDWNSDEDTEAVQEACAQFGG